MRSNLRYGPGELDISEMSARAGGGDLNGSFSMRSEAPDSPFKVAVKFRNVEAEQIVAEAGGEKGVVKGKLDGSFEAAGKITDPHALTGTGEIWLRDGQLRQYSVLAALGQVLQIEELTQLNLEQAQGKYHIDSGIVTIDELVLRSPNIRLSAKGTIGLDGKLRLQSELAINDKIRNQLFKPIRSNFRSLNEPGYYAVDFEIGGTIGRPKSNLVDQVVGRDLKDLGSVINSFLGGGKTDRKKKEAPADSVAGSTQAPAGSPQAAPTTSPSP
jgi:type II secretion system protein N